MHRVRMADVDTADPPDDPLRLGAVQRRPWWAEDGDQGGILREWLALVGDELALRWPLPAQLVVLGWPLLEVHPAQPAPTDVAPERQPVQRAYSGDRDGADGPSGRVEPVVVRLTVMAPRGVVHAWSDREARGSWGLHATLCGFVIDPTTGWGLRPTRGAVDCRRCIRLLTVA
jgi:hypothetical protein